ncbi:P1 family peptidase [Egicoccus sp. AB-alg2]|uniref:P1 family peptidase n=1 Tax=Egicoccus sp. AB-alg2 TaxID=3242693 RepID=UPI00359CBE27
MALGVAGVRVGTWTSPDGVSGCTVVLPPAGTIGALAVRGAAPGTREAAALGPSGKVTVCHGVVLSGGSAFGLASADGVMRWLEERDIGYRLRTGVVVPIVGAAIVLDESVMVRSARPGPDQGYAACAAAVTDDPPEGGVGVGAGCTVAKVAGLEHAWRGGQGVAVRSAAGVTVGALVANNAVGEVVGDDGRWIARARVPADAPRWPTDGRLLGARDDEPPGGDDGPEGVPTGAGQAGGPSGNTVLGCVVTDARLTKRDAHRVADLGHSGLARALRPAHTESDGDALFCLATGEVTASVDLVAHLAAEAVAEAVRRGPLLAAGRRGLPGLADGH